MSQENEKILKKIQRNEFSQTESALIILSFEKNLKQKEELLKRKADELQKLEGEMNDLNGQLSRVLEEIMRTDDQINTNRSMHASLIANLEKVELSLARKGQELSASTSEAEEMGRKLAERQAELGKMEEMLKEAERRENGAAEPKEEAGEGAAALEKKLKEKIAKQVQEEMTRHFKLTKKKELKAKLEG